MCFHRTNELTSSTGSFTCVGMRMHMGDFGLQSHPKDFCGVISQMFTPEKLAVAGAKPSTYVMVTHQDGDHGARPC